MPIDLLRIHPPNDREWKMISERPFMNENDMDRYKWRTGQRWSGDNRPSIESFHRLKSPGRAIFLVCIALIVTLVALILTR
jgi:hypothetical protein